jgi:hypothetical protein
VARSTKHDATINHPPTVRGRTKFPRSPSMLVASRAVRVLIRGMRCGPRLSAENRMIAVTEYPLQRQADRYRKVCEQILECRGRE